jgi:hypothetical protein
MSVQQLVSHFGECRHRLSELRARPDNLALSCAILRLEGKSETGLDDRPFARILNSRPIYEVLTVTNYESFTVAFYPVSVTINAEKIIAALAAVEAITNGIHPLLKVLRFRRMICGPTTC